MKEGMKACLFYRIICWLGWSYQVSTDVRTPVRDADSMTVQAWGGCLACLIWQKKQALTGGNNHSLKWIMKTSSRIKESLQLSASAFRNSGTCIFLCGAKGATMNKADTLWFHLTSLSRGELHHLEYVKALVPLNEFSFMHLFVAQGPPLNGRQDMAAGWQLNETSTRSPEICSVTA